MRALSKNEGVRRKCFRIPPLCRVLFGRGKVVNSTGVFPNGCLVLGRGGAADHAEVHCASTFAVAWIASCKECFSASRRSGCCLGEPE